MNLILTKGTKNNIKIEVLFKRVKMKDIELHSMWWFRAMLMKSSTKVDILSDVKSMVGMHVISST
jgi:hypothetical protein